jgi:hypothetical protein
MTLEKAKVILSTCRRNEIRDYNLGDAIVYWNNDSFIIAEGYYIRGRSSVWLYDDYAIFTGESARELYGIGIQNE